MDNVNLLPGDSFGKGFIPAKFIPEGKDEYYIRNQQFNALDKKFRHLKSEEIEMLVKNGNTAHSFDDIFVTDEFDPEFVKNSNFIGLIRLGRITNVVLTHNDLSLPVGIVNSTIIACDIGDDVAIQNVRYLAHYIIGDRCILANIDEMHTTSHAKFGNGIIKQGEDEDVRVWLDLMNETGSRQVLPFDEMITADACLWSKYRDDAALQQKLIEITQNNYDSARGYYGTVATQAVIKNSRILKDVIVGPHAYIKGVNKLKNLTIKSSPQEPTQIGEGVEMVNGIVGYGCRIFYGCKAVRFIIGNNSNLKYGARLLNSFMGDNSTVSCCEILNNLIFPAHEQHHNNSFLIASVVLGQSNLAAGATIGSNHNSRANDNEIQAGRGFWPGLCSSVKHSCRFASFILLAKGAYPAEMDIPLPFTLLNNNTAEDSLEIVPAFWWLHNMYALARNTWKFQNRDKRIVKTQNIEFDALAPDTAEEIINAMYILELCTGKAHLRKKGHTQDDVTEQHLAALGKEILSATKDNTKDLEILGENMEKTKRKVHIINVYKAYHAYGQMLHYYAIKNLMQYAKENPNDKFEDIAKKLAAQRVTQWTNLGGQLIPTPDVDNLRADIASGQLDSWQNIHDEYDNLWQKYTLDKTKHAFATLCHCLDTQTITSDQWASALDTAADIQQYICDQVYNSRKKDFDNPYRAATYRSPEEMNAAIGTIEDNSFVKQTRTETEQFKALVEDIKKRR